MIFSASRGTVRIAPAPACLSEGLVRRGCFSCSTGWNRSQAVGPHPAGRETAARTPRRDLSADSTRPLRTRARANSPRIPPRLGPGSGTARHGVERFGYERERGFLSGRRPGRSMYPLVQSSGPRLAASPISADADRGPGMAVLDRRERGKPSGTACAGRGDDRVPSGYSDLWSGLGGSAVSPWSSSACMS